MILIMGKSKTRLTIVMVKHHLFQLIHMQTWSIITNWYPLLYELFFVCSNKKAKIIGLDIPQSDTCAECITIPFRCRNADLGSPITTYGKQPKDAVARQETSAIKFMVQTIFLKDDIPYLLVT